MSGAAIGSQTRLLKRLAVGLGLAKPPKAPKSSISSGLDTKISQSLDQVLGWLSAEPAARILVSGDRAFFDAVMAKAAARESGQASAGRSMVWTSCLVEELRQGAANPDQIDFAAFDAVVCGGSQAGLSYRHAVARMAEVDPTRPVHWVGADWEFCGGTLPVPSEAEDAEALLFNHFQQFFGIKDPLLYRIEIYHGAERKHFTRILQPNESLLIRLSDFFPRRSAAACIAAFVSHPILTRGRHYRLRVCADVFWRDSFTTLHSAHEFKRSPSHKFEFRTPKDSVRSGDIVLTIPNYAKDLGEDATVSVFGGNGVSSVTRKPDAYLEEVKLTRNGGAEPFFGWKYRGYGGSFWYSFEGQQALRDGHRGSLSANHHVSVPIAERTDWSAGPEELAELRRLREAGFMVEPYPVPLVGDDDPLEFAVDFDASNPGLRQFRIFAFSGEGKLLGEFPYEHPGGLLAPAKILPRLGGESVRAAKLAIVSPDWQAIKIRRAGFKLLTQLVIENRRTGDRDVTEFQNCWRNCGVIVPNMPTFAGPGAVVFGRTNLFARARSGGGYRTALLSVNGSGSLDYKRTAAVEATVYNTQGRAAGAAFTMPPFGWRLDWIDDLIPDVGAHLGSAGNGALLVTSKNADLNCQIVTVSDRGAVSLQHMWGY
jgi:hypothetical protein